MQGRGWHLVHGDALDQGLKLPAGQPVCIITDPPYTTAEAYLRLAQLAMHVLPSGGNLVVFTGQVKLPENLAAMQAAGLQYQWLIPYMTGGTAARIFGRRMMSNYTAVAWFTKGHMAQKNWKSDVAESPGRDKRYHRWGKNPLGIAQFVEQFSLPEDTILDPYCGSAAIGVAALRLKRRYIGIELDAQVAMTAAKRLMAEEQALSVSSSSILLASETGVSCVANAVLVVAPSSNRKTGPVAATYISQATCPPSCKLKGHGCYGEEDRCTPIVRRLNASGIVAPVAIIQEEARQIDLLVKPLDLRLHVVGDFPNEIAAGILGAAVARYEARTGRRAWGYTHAWRDVEIKALRGASILASCENIQEVKSAMARGYAAVLLVERHHSKQAYLSDVFRVVPCPSQTIGRRCVDCRLCMRAAKLLAAKIVIALEAHGSGAKRIRVVLAGATNVATEPSEKMPAPGRSTSQPLLLSTPQPRQLLAPPLLLPNCELFNGDCIAGSKSLGDNSLDLLVLDPPFGLGEATFDRLYGRDKKQVIPGYVEAPQDYCGFAMKWLLEARRVLKPGGTIYLFSGWTRLDAVLNAVRSSGLSVLNHIIWFYNFGVFTRRKFSTRHYHVLRLAKGKNPKFNPFCRYGPLDKDENGNSLMFADLADVWWIKKEYHPGKVKNVNKLPDEIVRKIILYSSDPSDLIGDFFLGNFTTPRIALRLGRRAVGFELNPAACKHFFPLIKQIAADEFGRDLDERGPGNAAEAGGGGSR
jgi:site-specific DNA-methyltransferase (adenine-specific)